MTTKILTTVETEDWASLAEVRVEADADSIVLHLAGPDSSIAATDPMALRLTRADATDLHRQLGEALGVEGALGGLETYLRGVADRAEGMMHEAHRKTRDVEADLRAAVDERDRLAVDNARHAADFERCTDRIVELRRLVDAWKTASGLNGARGDPCDVEPSHLETYIGQLTRVAEAARSLTCSHRAAKDAAAIEEDVAMADALAARRAAFDALFSAVDTLPKEAP